MSVSLEPPMGEAREPRENFFKQLLHLLVPAKPATRICHRRRVARGSISWHRPSFPLPDTAKM